VLIATPETIHLYQPLPKSTILAPALAMPFCKSQFAAIPNPEMNDDVKLYSPFFAKNEKV
jgi:hypothetical protein